MTLTSARIHLASRSPRRGELLRQIGIAFEVLALRVAAPRGPDVDETPVHGEPADRYVLRLAREKALAGARAVARRRLSPMPVLAADTTVTLGSRILGKPADAAEAFDMLHSLSGTAHCVLTGLAVCHGEDMETALSESVVQFGELDDDDLRRYVDSGEPFDKAGAYGIQGLAGAFVRNLSGSYSGVMGLPLYETAQLLRKFGCRVP